MRSQVEEVARRAGVAVRERADELDVRRPDVDTLRRRGWTRRAALVAAVAVVAIGAVVAVLPAGVPGHPVIGDRPDDSVDPSEGEPATDRLRLADIPVRGSDETRPLWVWLTTDGHVCMALYGEGCVASPEGGLSAVLTGGAKGPDPEGCVSGAVGTEVAVVEVGFSDDTIERLEPISATGELEEVTVFATCWIGDRDVVEVVARDDSGDVLDRFRPTRSITAPGSSDDSETGAEAHVKCGPPPIDATYAVRGTSGPMDNTDEVEAGKNSPVTLDVEVTVHDRAHVEQLRFALVRLDDRSAETGSTLRIVRDLGEGQHQVELLLDGRTSDGDELPSARYRLQADADVVYVGEPQHPCDPATGGHSSAVSGLVFVRLTAE